MAGSHARCRLEDSTTPAWRRRIEDGTLARRHRTKVLEVLKRHALAKFSRTHGIERLRWPFWRSKPAAGRPMASRRFTLDRMVLVACFFGGALLTAIGIRFVL